MIFLSLPKLSSLTVKPGKLEFRQMGEAIVLSSSSFGSDIIRNFAIVNKSASFDFYPIESSEPMSNCLAPSLLLIIPP